MRACVYVDCRRACVPASRQSVFLCQCSVDAVPHSAGDIHNLSSMFASRPAAQIVCLDFVSSMVGTRWHTMYRYRIILCSVNAAGIIIASEQASGFYFSRASLLLHVTWWVLSQSVTQTLKIQNCVCYAVHWCVVIRSSGVYSGAGQYRPWHPLRKFFKKFKKILLFLIFHTEFASFTMKINRNAVKIFHI